MFDNVVPAMRHAAAQALRRSFSFKDQVAVAPDLNLRTIKRDWEVGERQDWSDEFIVACVRDRLFGTAAPWVTTSREEAIAHWLDGDLDTPQDKFVAAMTTLYRKMLELPETLPRWQVHIGTACAMSASWAGDSPGRDTSPEEGSADHKLASELAVLRNDFFENALEQWTSPLAVVLAEMERRPRPGVTVRMIVSLLHRCLDGFVLWSLIAGERCGGEDERLVGVATLALVEGLTEPDRAAPEVAAPGMAAPAVAAAEVEASGAAPPEPSDLRHWVRAMAPEVTAELYRGRPSGDDDPPSAGTLRREDVLAQLRAGAPAADQGELAGAFDDEYPDMPALRDAALRTRLTRRVEVALELRDERPQDVLRQVTSNLVSLTRTDPALLQACRRDRAAVAGAEPSYLAEVEDLLTDLLGTIGAEDARGVAGTLLDRALSGDRKTVQTLLKLTLRDLDEKAPGRRASPGRP